MAHDFDWLVIGSGFGGSVSALRLCEKGYSVGVLECGRRRFYEDPQWAGLADWETALAPHYDTAERMLGVVAYDQDDPADDLLREYAREIGVEDTYAKTRVGVLLGGGAPGENVPDPFFGGSGPDRTVCLRCGRCMVGCPVGAKNTLVKNYLYLAEQRGVEVIPDRTVTEIRPIGAADGSDGYTIASERSGMIPGRGKRTLRTRGVVVAAGALGTNKLLQRCRL